MIDEYTFFLVRVWSVSWLCVRLAAQPSPQVQSPGWPGDHRWQHPLSSCGAQRDAARRPPETAARREPGCPWKPYAPAFGRGADPGVRELGSLVAAGFEPGLPPHRCCTYSRLHVVDVVQGKSHVSRRLLVWLARQNRSCRYRRTRTVQTRIFAR